MKDSSSAPFKIVLLATASAAILFGSVAWGAADCLHTGDEGCSTSVVCANALSNLFPAAVDYISAQCTTCPSNENGADEEATYSALPADPAETINDGDELKVANEHLLKEQVLAALPQTKKPEQIAKELNSGKVLGETTEGFIMGNAKRNAEEFLGIPYAAPPTGTLRWRPPRDPLKRPNGVIYDATRQGKHCIQLEVGKKSSLASLLADPKDSVESEDCLYLNIFAPSKERIRTMPGGSAPVLFFVHGGYATFGGNSVPIYNGLDLAQNEDVVVVVVNYRLGIFGFLASHELEQEAEQIAKSSGRENDPITRSFGNYGMLDVMAALRWVQRNIAFFGGNPENVTLMGHSAGAIISLHATMAFGYHESFGLPMPFHKVIASGASVMTFPTRGISPNDDGHSQRIFNHITSTLNCNIGNGGNDDPLAVVACLRTVNAMDIKQLGLKRRWMHRFTPLIDGHILPFKVNDMLASGHFARVPILATSCSEEGVTSVPREASYSYENLRSVVMHHYTPEVTDKILQIYNVDPKGQHDWFNIAVRIFTDAIHFCPSMEFLSLASKHTGNLYFHTFSQKLPIGKLARVIGFEQNSVSFHGIDIMLFFAATKLILVGSAGAIADVRNVYMPFIKRDFGEREGTSVIAAPNIREADEADCHHSSFEMPAAAAAIPKEDPLVTAQNDNLTVNRFELWMAPEVCKFWHTTPPEDYFLDLKDY